MTPERIAELRELNQVYGETWFFHPTLGELLNAIEAAQQEIAVDAGRLRDAAMRVWGEDAHGCDTPDRLADAILGLRAQIADLKRGGVDAAELDAISDAIRCIGNDAHHASTGPAVPDALWDIRRRAYDVCARIDGIHPIPADRVLREGEARIGMNELQMLRCFAGRRMSEREHDRLEACRDAHEDKKRAQAKGAEA